MKIVDALQTRMKFDVRIFNNFFTKHQNANNSKTIVAFNSNNSNYDFLSIRNIEVSDNYFEGFFRFAVNAGDSYDGTLSQNVIVKRNKFLLFDVADEATLLNVSGTEFAKTRSGGSIIENNIISR